MQGICGGQGGAVREPSAPHAPRSSPWGKKMFVRQWLSSQVLEILFPPHPLQMKWLVVSRWLPCKWQDFRELMSKTWWSSNISPHQRASQYCWKFGKQPWEWCLPRNKWPLDNGFVKLTKAARAPEVVPPAWLKTVFILLKSSKGQFYSFTVIKHYMVSQGIQNWWYIQQNSPVSLPSTFHLWVDCLFLCNYSRVCRWTITNKGNEFF